MSTMTLKQARVAAGLSQAKLARAAGVDPMTVWRIEVGRHTPTDLTMHRLAVALGIHPTQILLHGGEGTPRAHTREPQGNSRQAEPAKTTQGKDGQQ